MRSAVALPRFAVVPRIAFGASAVVLAAAAAWTIVAPSDAHPAPAPAPALSQRLGLKTWALAIPVSWLSAPIPGLRDDDVLDVLGARAGERATASEVASGLRVMAIDDRTVVVELTADDASAIVSARARGLSLTPILRSAR